MTNLPLGLPDGSVRSILALSLTAATIYLWVTGAQVPSELLAVNSLVVGNYFGSRSTEADPQPNAEPLPAPYIPGEVVDAPYIPDGNG